MKANAAKWNGNAEGGRAVRHQQRRASRDAVGDAAERSPLCRARLGRRGVDASVQAVVMQWPVINPLSRYRHARRLLRRRQSAGLAEGRSRPA